MATKTYDGSSTLEISFTADPAGNLLQVSNIDGWSEYRDGDDLIIFSSDKTNYLKVIGAYADATRLDFIEYFFDGKSSGEIRSVSTIAASPTSGLHFIAGTFENDTINGVSASSLSATGYLGNDQITGSDGPDYLGGNEGNDTIVSGTGNDVLLGGSGNDTLDGGDGGDYIDGGDGDDTIFGGAGNDIIDDGLGSDVVDAGDGIDTYTREFNDNTWIPHVDLMNEGLFSPTFPDIKGDTLISFENVDLKSTVDVIITGNDDNNILSSGNGNDKIYGGAGDDTLDGGAGSNLAFGGTGDDTYVSTGYGYTEIVDTSGVDTVYLYWNDLDGNFISRNPLRLGNDFVILNTAKSETLRFIDAFVLENPLELVQFYDPSKDYEYYTTGAFTLSLTDQMSDGGDIIYVGSDDAENIDTGDFGNRDIYANGGDDIIDVGDGNRWVFGGSGDDKITVRGSSDTHLFGESGNDTIAGDNGNDYIEGGDGDDVLSAGDGDDTLIGGDGNDDLIDDWGGNDHFDGGDGFDRLFTLDQGATSGAIINVEAGTITSRFFPPAWSETPEQDEVDTFTSIEGFGGTDQDDVFIGSEVDEAFYGNGGNDSGLGGAGDDVLIGGDGNDTLDGGVGDDYIDGGAGDDILRGGDGDDLLLTGSGDDFLYGEAGDDTLRISGTGFSTLDGGDGSDTFLLDMTNYTPTIDDFVAEINLATGRSGALGVQSELADQLISIENIDYRGPIASQLTGNDEDNVISGGAGDDVIRGGAGDDTLITGAGDDQVFGETGNDIIIQSGSGTQHYDGGDGIDTLKLDIGFLGASFNERITVDLTNGFSGLTDYPDHELNDTLTNIENIDFNNVTFDLELIGDVNDNILIAGSGNDRINGLAGNDTINGGAGEDALFYHLASSAISVDSSLGIATDGLSGTDTFQNIEAFIGSEYSDTLLGRDTDENVAIELNAVNGDPTNYEQFQGGAGDDIIDGRGGYDEISYTTSQAGLTIDLKSSSISDGLGGIDTISNIEGVEATNYDDTIYGTDGANSLDGRFGNNIIDGRDGYDFVEYNGDGRHNLNADLSTGFASFTKGADGTSYTDTLISIEGIIGSSNSDTIKGDANHNKLYGGAGDDKIYGGSGNDYLATGDGDDQLFGEAGDDILHISGSGAAALDGGDGVDTILLNLTNYTPPIDDFVAEINLATGRSGALGVQSELADQLISIENIDYRGPIASQLTGNDEDNVISGGAGDDVIRGGAGNDHVNGGAGDDTLKVGFGADLVIGGSGEDAIYLSSSEAYTRKFSAKNTSSKFQTGTHELINLKDYLKTEDVVDGSQDSDTIHLGSGKIALFLHDAFSAFHGKTNLTTDAFENQSAQRINNIENIFAYDGDNIIDLTSTDYSLAGEAIKVSGGNGNDVIWGSDADEIILGDTGNDILFGGAGENKLFGGEGADEFQFTKTSKNDRIEDFNLTDGDTLKFFNKGGARFDRDSISLNSAGDELSIAYGSDADDVLTISLTNAGLQFNDLTTDVLIIA